MIRAVLSGVLLAGLSSFPALGQQVEAEGQAPAEQEATEQAEPAAFDAEPFLNSMIAVRGASLTCDPFVGGNPALRTQGIVGYFQALGQDLPDLTDGETQASLQRFIGSQAAMLCVSMLESAFAQYQVVATNYEANRPAEWPAAPAVEPGPWCAQPFCLDR